MDIKKERQKQGKKGPSKITGLDIGTGASLIYPILGSKEYGWNHGLSEVVNALTEAGLHIEYLKEFDESPYNVLPDLIETETGMFVTKDKLYPLIFELKAIKV